MVTAWKYALTTLTFALLALAFSIAMRWHEPRHAAYTEPSLGWPSVTGLIIESNLETGRSTLLRRERSKRLRIVYEYVVDNHSYENDVVRLDQDRLTLAEKTLLVGTHPVGRTVDVFYNPRRPSQAVLMRGPYE